MPRLALTLLIVCLLAACGSSDLEPEAHESPSASETSTSPTTTPTPTPAESATPTATAAEVEIECWGNKANTIGTPDQLSLFWPRHFDDCSWGKASGTPSKKEQRALEAAYPKNPKVKSLTTLYGICAENDKKWLDYIRTAGSEAQLREVRGVLILCPDHPQRKKVEGFIKIAEANNELEAEGRIFYDGTYRVGKKVPAGTYFAKPGGDGCYWERTDAAGNIIDNNFTNGLRVEMTVYPSDYSITVRGCGEWRPVL